MCFMYCNSECTVRNEQHFYIGKHPFYPEYTEVSGPLMRQDYKLIKIVLCYQSYFGISRIDHIHFFSIQKSGVYFLL